MAILFGVILGIYLGGSYYKLQVKKLKLEIAELKN